MKNTTLSHPVKLSLQYAFESSEKYTQFPFILEGMFIVLQTYPNELEKLGFAVPPAKWDTVKRTEYMRNWYIKFKDNTLSEHPAKIPLSAEAHAFMELAEIAATFDAPNIGYGGPSFAPRQIEMIHLFVALVWKLGWKNFNTFEAWFRIQPRSISRIFRNSFAKNSDAIIQLNNLEITYKNAPRFEELIRHRNWVELAAYCSIMGVSPEHRKNILSQKEIDEILSTTMYNTDRLALCQALGIKCTDIGYLLNP